MGVRLGKKVQRLQARADEAAAAEAAKSCGYVISYSGGGNVRVDSATLMPGDLVAMDVHATSTHGEVRTVERVTRDPDDLGYVYDAAGVMVGRLLELRRPFFAYCIQDGAVDPWPDGPDDRGVHDGGAVEPEC